MLTEKEHNILNASNDRSDYKVTIVWADEYKRHFAGLLKLIEDEKNKAIKYETPKQFISNIEFNEACKV